MKNKKGFTLIELLAVIVILGLLMAIAIPSITKYITQSRKKTLTTTMGNYINALINEVNDLKYTFTGQNTIYAVPIECIALERGGTDPFGHWYQANDGYWAYVLVQYDDIYSRYTYGFTFKDSAGYGLYPKVQGKIKENGSQIQTGLEIERPYNNNLLSTVTLSRWHDSGFVVDENTKLVVLTATSDDEVGDGRTTCTLAQKGKNYAEVEGLAYKPIEINKKGEANLEVNVTLEDQAIYNDKDNDKAVTINGNGYTVTQTITPNTNLEWEGGRYPPMAYLFTSTNGSKVTVNDLTITGQAQTVMLGHYVNSTYKNFNTELNDVNIIGLEVFSFSQGIAPAVVVYGTATLNNCNVYDTKLSTLDTEGYTVYDLAVVNYTTTTVNNSKIGAVYTWNHAKLTFNNSDVDIIETKITKSKGDLVIGNGSHVETIKATYNKNLKITIKSGAVVDTLDLSAVTDLSSCIITIEDGAVVKNTINP